MICNRLLGGSVRDCDCRLPPWDRENGGGWLRCPPDARGLLEPVPIESPAKPLATTAAIEREARTGDICQDCGSLSMVRTGTCLTCQDCGSSSGGCSIDTDAIRAATDLVALISERVALVRRGQEWYGLCPFHAERTPSFAIVPNKHFYHCHGCGAHGDALDWIMQTENVSLIAAARRLGGEPANESTRTRLTAERRERERRQRDRLARTARLEAYRDRNPDCGLPAWAIRV